MERLPYPFYHRHALDVAPELVGKLLVHEGGSRKPKPTAA